MLLCRLPSWHWQRALVLQVPVQASSCPRTPRVITQGVTETPSHKIQQTSIKNLNRVPVCASLLHACQPGLLNKQAILESPHVWPCPWLVTATLDVQLQVSSLPVYHAQNTADPQLRCSVAFLQGTKHGYGSDMAGGHQGMVFARPVRVGKTVSSRAAARHMALSCTAGLRVLILATGVS